MYAVIQDSGKQFKVAKGDVINIDVRPLPEGATTVEFTEVLFVGQGPAPTKTNTGEGSPAAAPEAAAATSPNFSPRFGTPLLEGAKVTARLTKPAERVRDDETLVEGEPGSRGSFNIKGPKLYIYHIRRRRSKNRTKVGHRQKYIQVEIADILLA